MRIGLAELLVIAIAALALLNPKLLKEYSKSLGKTFKTLKDEKERAEAELIDPIKEDVREIRNEIDEVKTPINDLIAPIREIEETVKGNR